MPAALSPLQHDEALQRAAPASPSFPGSPPASAGGTPRLHPAGAVLPPRPSPHPSAPSGPPSVKRGTLPSPPMPLPASFPLLLPPRHEKPPAGAAGPFPPLRDGARIPAPGNHRRCGPSHAASSWPLMPPPGRPPPGPPQPPPWTPVPHPAQTASYPIPASLRPSCGVPSHTGPTSALPKRASAETPSPPPPAVPSEEPRKHAPFPPPPPSGRAAPPAPP